MDMGFYYYYYLKALLFFSLSWKVKSKKMKNEGPKASFSDLQVELVLTSTCDPSKNI